MTSNDRFVVEISGGTRGGTVRRTLADWIEILTGGDMIAHRRDEGARIIDLVRRLSVGASVDCGGFYVRRVA